MSEWIDVKDRLPANENWKKFKVKIEVGPINKNIYETVVLGKLQHGYYRWMAGDWGRVTHWKEPGFNLNEPVQPKSD